MPTHDITLLFTGVRNERGFIKILLPVTTVCTFFHILYFSCVCTYSVNSKKMYEVFYINWERGKLYCLLLRIHARLPTNLVSGPVLFTLSFALHNGVHFD